MTLASLVIPLQPSGRISDDRATLNANAIARHTMDGPTTVNHAASPYTLLATDHFILADATAGVITIALPAAAGCTGWSCYIQAKSISGGNITIDPAGSENINGASTKVISVQWDAVRIVCDGTAWYAVKA